LKVGIVEVLTLEVLVETAEVVEVNKLLIN
jgi:hypothetical protein